MSEGSDVRCNSFLFSYGLVSASSVVSLWFVCGSMVRNREGVS